MIFEALVKKEKAISITGLGYVGLPLALELAKYFSVIGFDINPDRVDLLNQNIDPSKELSSEDFIDRDIRFTDNPEDLRDASFHIISTPTDINKYKKPDLSLLLLACENLGKVVKRGDYIVFESTVYPGCTEEDCIPVIEQESGLKSVKDFKVGYSPERIVPGDKNRPFIDIVKIVSGCDEESLNEIDKLYNHILNKGTFRAKSIKVAEAAKVIENIQRDLNISLMNELSIIFDKIGIDTSDVIEAAGTKWNFHKYQPGLVGGHCIGIDPYYLIHKSIQLGHEPEVIAAGRKVNDSIPSFIAKRLIQVLIEKNKNLNQCKVLVLGITFKENVADIRNSKVPNLVSELEDYSLSVDISDPYADQEQVNKYYGLDLINDIDQKYDAIVIAVPHDAYKSYSKDDLMRMSNGELILFDIKGVKDGKNYENYWKL